MNYLQSLLLYVKNVCKSIYIYPQAILQFKYKSFFWNILFQYVSAPRVVAICVILTIKQCVRELGRLDMKVSSYWCHQ